MKQRGCVYAALICSLVLTVKPASQKHVLSLALWLESIHLLPVMPTRGQDPRFEKTHGRYRDEEQNFADWVVGLLNFTANPERAYQCRDELWDYLDPVIAERRRNPQNDVISHFN